MNLILPEVMRLVDAVMIRPRAATGSRRCHHRDVLAPVDRRDRRGQLDRNSLGELRQQRAETLPAEGVDLTFRRLGVVRRRDLREVLAAQP